MSNDPNPSFATSLRNPDTWIVLFVVAFFGVLGGFLSMVLPRGPDGPPWYAYLISGLVAALAMFLFLRPNEANGPRLLALSIVAGFIGQPIIDSVQARVQAVIAKRDAAQATSLGTKAAELAKDDNARAQRLQKMIDTLIKLNPKNSNNVPEEIAKPDQTLATHQQELEGIAAELQQLKSRYPNP